MSEAATEHDTHGCAPVGLSLVGEVMHAHARGQGNSDVAANTTNPSCIIVLFMDFEKHK